MRETPTIHNASRLSNYYVCGNDAETNFQTGAAANWAGSNILIESGIFTKQQLIDQMSTNIARRIVQVIIADPNENVPLESALLFKGEEMLTDLTDTELYFANPLAELLAAHNAKRVTWLDKEATRRSGKDVFLEQVKIRDLRMVVVVVAQFAP